MNKHWMWALFAVTVLACAAQRQVRAEEGKEPKEAKASRTVENKDAGEDKSFGDKFTSFWIHDVGGTIHGGLSKGADKIQNAFTGGSKEKDIEKRRQKEALKRKEAQEKSEATKP
ncbi:MAG: hypothetical protein KIS92_17145 [Planctomycetota bacterium]|nr:hypothetical protein [Planctomycetota bacterium]